jgi:UDP-glucose 4-epimerase
MRLMVVGGAGFIGSHLVDALVDQGHEVTVLDNLSTGKPEYLNPAARFVEADISAPGADFVDHFRGIQGLFHTAALARVPRSIEDPLGTHQANVTGTLNVLKAAVDAAVGRVVYSSSSSVYGDQPGKLMQETMAPNPLNPYACQKWMGEIYCRNFKRVYGLSSVCLRYFNVYGPRQAMEGAYRLVIGIFLSQRAAGAPLTINGDGEQTRDFTHVRDVVRANLRAMESQNVGAGEPINVGSGRDVSINYIASLIGGPVKHVAPRPFEERFKQADVVTARKLLEWEPRVRVEDGIKELLRLYCA